MLIWNWNLEMKLTLLSDDLELIGYEIDNNWQTGMKKYYYDYDMIYGFSDMFYDMIYDMI